MDALKETALSLKEGLATFNNRLENARDRIEGAARLHHLLGLNLKEDDDAQQEMQKLADKIGDPGLVEKCRDNASKNMSFKATVTSTPKASIDQIDHQLLGNNHSQTTIAENDSKENTHCECWRNVAEVNSNKMARSLTGELAATSNKSKHYRCGLRMASDDEEDDEEDQSKMADSGLGYCDQCERNEKMTRSCSCQSFDEPTNASSKR